MHKAGSPEHTLQYQYTSRRSRYCEQYSSSLAEKEGEEWCVQLVVGEGHVVAGVVLQVEGVLAGNEDDLHSFLLE